MIDTASEPQPGAGRLPPGTRSRALGRAARHPDDHFLAFVEVTAEDLGGGAIAQTEHHVHLHGISIRPHDPGPARRSGSSAPPARLIVQGLLLRGEELPDAYARGLADLLRLRL